MRRILYLQYPSRMWRERYAGICRYACQNDAYVLMLERVHNKMTIRNILKTFRPDGCVVEGGITLSNGFKLSDFDGIPVVFCDPIAERMSGAYSGVRHDAERAAVLASRELLRLDLAHYAFVGNFQPRDWSDARRDRFVAEMTRAGKSIREFSGGGAGGLTVNIDTLRRWLKDLPKPCGIFAATDYIAQMILVACQEARINVPQEIAVIGVDNDEMLCENTVPTLTSVASDFELSGYVAAALLDERMKDMSIPDKVVTFGSERIVRRKSTYRFKHIDSSVVTAVDYIARNYLRYITPADVIVELGVSRRSAETRFREQTGHTIGEEITRKRLTAAKEVLIRAEFPISEIHTQCGYRSESSLRKAFLKFEGMSMNAWRRAQMDR